MRARREELLGEPLVMPKCAPWEEDRGNRFAWCGEHSAITIVTPDPGDDPAQIGFDITSPGGAGTLRLTGEGVDRAVRTGPQPTRVQIQVQAGEQYLRIEFDAAVPAVVAPGDERDLRFTVSNLRT